MPSNMPDARAVNEALRRAREMQNRSAVPRESEPIRPSAPEDPKEIREQPHAPQSLQHTEKSSSPLDFLLQDKERTLLIILLLLLTSEKNSPELLFVLMYLLV